MTWRLFLDDDVDTVRKPQTTVENPEWRRKMDLPASPPDTGRFGDWRVARSYLEAVVLFNDLGLPKFVSFDHDLTDGKDGIAVAHLIVETDLDASGGALSPEFTFEVHSGNRVGRGNIAGLLTNYMASKSSPKP